MWRFINEKKAQISAEMIIVMAAILGIAVLLIVKLRKNATKTANKIDTTSKDLFSEIDKIDTNYKNDMNHD